MNETEYVVYCAAHQHYLRHASAAGTSWAGDPKQARRYQSKAQARKAADAATWLDHNPAPWPVAETTVYLTSEPGRTPEEERRVQAILEAREAAHKAAD